MKKILTGAIAAIALVGVASPAAAQQTNENHYAGIPVLGNVTNPSFGTTALNIGVLAGIGTRYTANAGASSNVGTVGNVDVSFTLKGAVSKDCSFYAGNNASATTLNFGTIGIQAGNNVNVSDAFEMTGPAAAVVTSATAGCNFHNNVKIEKSSASGMVNTNPTLSYDSNQFQANIPYRVDAAWTGVLGGAGAVAGTPQSLSVSETQLTNTIGQGAWRSGMILTFLAPVAAKALVAGQYEGTTRLTLTAL
ncbi:hypothetical protein SAMN05428974_0829 [Sphingopyxis sp. YR583]|uniref:hypothetical protein n=1 Tax=Sphingopyxis sp. YR583 TaxID=1881047 RepID=UPI0008A79FFE|nr:hypothetical protein [Sphingopyxis sp. YR583]SEH13570.1 hypothetical protein SAMN05428974_0829 [Sphingopyxis sp. YR583]